MLDRPRQAEHGDYACSMALQTGQAAQAQSARNCAGAGRRLAAVARSGTAPRSPAPASSICILKPGAKQRVVPQVLASRGCLWQMALWARARRCRWNSSRPIRPARCTSAMVAAPRTARASPTCWRPPGSTSRASSTSTMPAGRWTSWRCPPGCATWSCNGVVVAFPPNAYQGDYVREMGAGNRSRAWHALRARRRAHAPTACRRWKPMRKRIWTP